VALPRHGPPPPLTPLDGTLPSGTSHSMDVTHHSSPAARLSWSARHATVAMDGALEKGRDGLPRGYRRRDRRWANV